MEEISVDVKHISKKFRLYHEKRTSVYESVLGYFSRKKHYEVLQALDDVSFDVKKGEMFGIIGKNGSGKTTLLRILSHIYQPDSGSVDVKGTIIPVLALGLGFHPELTATTNIVQSGILLGFSRKQISDKINDVIRFAELEKFADTKIKNFSSGMQMRLAFSTAIQVDPDVLILDEVFAVGDLNFQKKCFDTIMDFKKRGKSIIFVSHDMAPIRDFCDRAMFLNNGKVETIGKPSDAIAAYVDFLGRQKQS
ncbi:MAG: ABC transporter ATP-binding protein [Nitrosarchaeum sp.]|nr:ABC transporter ATP-binding protein [Nitrosarchaeum sp.]